MPILARPHQGNTGQCQPGDPCWPTAGDIAELRQKLNPSSSRKLNWKGYPEQGQPFSVPKGSESSQILYGLGSNCTEIDALYENPELGTLCYTEDWSANNDAPDHCKAATRNQPYEGWTPAFIVFCENADQVRIALEFAVQHDLCVMVASTGHEYLNRHSCPTGGMMIRATAMKGAEFIEKWERNPVQAPHGAFRFGVGLTFSEAHKFAAENGRVISSGWCNTVGWIGWSLDGGHGPLAPSLGLGVDNSLEFTLLQVHEDDSGEKKVMEVVANAMSNPALFWAMKGGGGSTWGIVTSITVRAHPIPQGGFTQLNISTHGTICQHASKGSDTHNFPWFKEMWQKYAEWQTTLNENFSIQTSVWPKVETPGDYCSGSWSVVLTYIYNGPEDDLAQVKAREELLITLPTFYQEVTQYAGDQFAIRPAPAKPTNTINTGAQSSILVDRDMMKKRWAEVFGEILDWCPERGQCPFHYLYLAFTGNLGSPQATNTALSPGMRTYMMAHNARDMSLEQLNATLYSISDYSYFSESAYVMENWGKRYWGDNYDMLRAVKKRYDPFGIFWCHHCVGDEATI